MSAREGPAPSLRLGVIRTCTDTSYDSSDDCSGAGLELVVGRFCNPSRSRTDPCRVVVPFGLKEVLVGSGEGAADVEVLASFLWREAKIGGGSRGRFVELDST